MPVAIVTGANRGIGLELCRQLRARGQHVVAVCRQSSAELDASGCQVRSGIDVTRAGCVAELCDSLGAERVSLLINNAGVLATSDLGSLDFEAIRRQLEVNAVAPLRVCEALLPKLDSGSKIALITSRMGSIADNSSGGAYGYRMSKAALNAAGASLAHDLRARGIPVILLHPGYVRTRMTEGRGMLDPAQSAEQLLARIDGLTLEQSGAFFHASGERLPW